MENWGLVRAAWAAVGAFVALAAAPQPTPVHEPRRDVQVVYDVLRGSNTITEISRWQIATKRQRVDYPAFHSYMIADGIAKRAYVVDTSMKNVKTLSLQPGLLDKHLTFKKLGDTVIAGYRCTFWNIGTGQNEPGASEDICLTDDGVTLDVRIGGKEQTRARNVIYGPADPNAFVLLTHPNDFH